MKKKDSGMGAFGMAMIFAVCFGAVGVFTGWVIASTLSQAWSVRGWTKVDAEVVRYGGADDLEYKYRVGDREFTGRRLGIGALENMEVDHAVNERITRAFNDKQPLAVLVDPNEPLNSVADGSIPWTLVLFMTPFALGFGGVGLGALYVAVRQLIPAAPEEEKQTTISSDAGGGFLALLGFTFLWNALAMPISALFVPEMIRTGEWLGLIVLIFPLAGLLMIWGTIHSGINWLRRGGATVQPQQLPPRLGSAFSGYVSFRRGVTAGATMRARLSCLAGSNAGQNAPPVWTKELGNLRVADVGGNRRLSFRFDPPDRVPGFDRDAVTHWRLELYEEGKTSAAYGFNFKMQPPAGIEHLPEEELRADAEPELDDEDMPVPAGIPKGLEGIAALVGKERIEERLKDMPASQRAKLRAQFENLPAGQKAALEKMQKYAHYMPTVKKLVFWAIGLFVLFQIVGVVSVFLAAS